MVGTTNRLDSIDSALRRPGRFDEVIMIPLPDLQSRAAILHYHCRHLPLHQQSANMITTIPSSSSSLGASLSVDWMALARATKGMSGIRCIHRSLY